VDTENFMQKLTFDGKFRKELAVSTGGKLTYLLTYSVKAA